MLCIQWVRAIYAGVRNKEGAFETLRR